MSSTNRNVVCAACAKERGIKPDIASGVSHSVCRRHAYELYGDALSKEAIDRLGEKHPFAPDLGAPEPELESLSRQILRQLRSEGGR